MTIRKNDTDKPVNDKDDEGLLEKIAKTIAPPSREVSDAELIDPGANSPAAKPNDPEKSSTPDSARSARPSQGNRRA
ncbi:MAG: hypothetical protein A3I66_00530 [Burkholderiales bacterium RIFCSPLOWO2_02_FULL_57_36]|nr:MAG: hypothetical protein A3I66_00530 [Burkholderiales bacterium RIFCSPLOWO2_02_FULL_57_36]